MFQTIRARRPRLVSAGAFALAALAAATLISACSNPVGSSATTNGGNGGVVVINVNNVTSPTPTFNPVTLGAWVSNMTPQQGDNITVYAFVRVQDPTMQGPSKPPQNLVTVTFNVNGTNGTAQTDSDGLAAYHTKATGQPTVPVVIVVTATVNGLPIHAQTFYTILPTAPPGVTPGATPSASATP